MASVVVASLRATMEFEIQQPSPLVHPDDLQHMKSLLTNLANLQVFLENFHIKAHEDDEIKRVEHEIKDFALKAEDEIEVNLRNILLAKDASKRKEEEAFGEFHQSLEEIGNRMEKLLPIVKKHNDAYKLKPSSEQEFIPSEPTKLKDEMVGHKKELKDILDQLIRGSSELQIISTSGMGGIGKTTLARRVYEDPEVMRRFDTRAWTTVSQEHQVKHVISALLRCIDESITAEEIKKSSKDELAEKLQKLLKIRRYLIVVDDVWSKGAWDEINPCFPDVNNGSRILLTTRSEEVAGYTSSGNQIHPLNFLEPEESWYLFSRDPDIKNRMALSPEFVAVGEKVVVKCKGLPLSIVIVAGLLSTKTSLGEWDNIQEELSSVLSADKQCSRIVDLSYKHLPPDLKPCFLHLSVFPEDTEMPVKKLVRLWISEGFVKVVSDKTLEDIAHEYLKSLVRRSLVLVRNWSSKGKIKICNMHDLMHEYCVSKAENENLLYAGSMRRRLQREKADSNDGNNGRVKHEGFRWLSFWPNYGNVYICYNLDKSRSLSFLHRDAIPTLIGQCLLSNLLRVLDLIQLPPLSNGIFMSLRGLPLLRYMDIALDDCLSSEELASVVSKTQNLQTLIVSQNGSSDTNLPCEVLDSLQLRHVEVSYSLSVDPPSPSKVNEALHTLYWLSLDHCTKEVVSRIPNVKKLGILCGCDQPSPNAIELANLNNLGHLGKLETLMIAFRKDSPTGLENLNSLPLYLNIKKLKLKRTCLAWSEINIIGMLPNLEVLKLKEASNGLDWEPDEEKESSKGNFDNLKFLFIEARDLARWEIYEGEHFPCIERLVLRRCTNLTAIPPSFKDINTLESIELKNCNRSVLDSAHAINDARLEDGCGYKTIVIRHVEQLQEGAEDNDASPE